MANALPSDHPDPHPNLHPDASATDPRDLRDPRDPPSPSRAATRWLLTTPAVRRLERSQPALLADGTLMRRAATAVAAVCARLLAGRPPGAPVVVLAGPGNNGADALLAGLMLHRSGWPIHALSCAPSPAASASSAASASLPSSGTPVPPSPSSTQPSAQSPAPSPAQSSAQSPDNARFTAVWRQAAARDPAHVAIDDAAALDPATLARHLDRAGLIIDGLFGIGLSRRVDGIAARLIEQCERSRRATGCPVVAVDAPSGLDVDRGSPADGVADSPVVQATHTVTMIADKPGLHTGLGRQCAGEVIVADLQVPAADAARLSVDEAGLLLRDCPAPGFARRAVDTHKGSFGTLLIAGGSQGMAGAALLAAGGAQAAGIGKLAISGPDGPVFDPGQPQWMTREWRRLDPAPDAIVAGCGLGQTIRAVEGLTAILAQALPLVIDADALVLIADRPALRATLLARRGPRILTPHPLEAARLLGSSTADVQRDRIAAAHRLAIETDSVVVLKGAGSIVADAHGWAIIDAGDPTLATAGTGDVLAGLIGALLAQGLPARDAARLGAWTHARAGEWAARDLPASIGFRAGELPDYLRRVINAAATGDNGGPPPLLRPSCRT
ncbi:MAG: NAD(P)H-hydrate dehydratase [Burkholderiaceae bacterium]